MSDWTAAPLLDHARLDEFAQVLSEEQLARLVAAFARELQTRPSMIVHLMRQGDLSSARSAAHLLKGAALSIGGNRIAALAAAIEEADLAEAGRLAEALPECALDTLSAVDRLDTQAR
jgi:HPt (histidine-containing phosphotransfer) domain-containing protein